MKFILNLLLFLALVFILSQESVSIEVSNYEVEPTKASFQWDTIPTPSVIIELYPQDSELSPIIKYHNDSDLSDKEIIDILEDLIEGFNVIEDGPNTPYYNLPPERKRRYKTI